MTLSPKEQFELQRLQPEQLAAEPRSAEAFDFWLDESRHVSGLGGKVNARLRLAKLAIPQNRRVILQKFIDRKPSRVDFTTAHVAAVLNSPEVLELSLKRKDDLAKVWLRRTCLGLAAEMGHVEMVEALLERRAPRTVPSALDPLSLGKEYPAVLQRLATEGLSSEQLQMLLRSAAQKGDRDEIERLASRLEQLPPELFLRCKDEATAVFVLETLPALGSDRVCAASGGESDVLAETIIARGEVRARDIASHCARMSEEGLLRLVSACAKIGARLGDGFSLGSVIDVAATRSKIRVVQALEARGAKITAKTRRRLLEEPSLSTPMRMHLIDSATLSHADFLRAPAAEGFSGRFSDGRFFGLALGDPKPKAALPDVRVQSREGLITEIRYGRYDIPGDAFEAISQAIVQEHGAPTTEDATHRVWADAEREISLRNEMQDAGLLTSLAVRRNVPPAATAPESLVAAFEMTFPGLENVEFRPRAAGFEIAADLRGRDECIVFRWPTNPMGADSFEPQFVEAVLAEQRAMEDA